MREQNVSVITWPPKPCDEETLRCAHRHLRFAWWSLLFFLTLGIVLEALHGLKVRWYLDVSQESRRLMWTLAHAHGTLLALIHAVFALTVFLVSEPGPRWRRVASPCLIGASFLLPGGFFLGGVFIYDGDPGVGVFLVPLGALFLLISVFLTARAVTSAKVSNGKHPTKAKRTRSK